MKENYQRPTVTDMSKVIKDDVLIKIVNSLVRLSARPIAKKDGISRRNGT